MVESVAVGRQLGISHHIENALTNACYTWWLGGDWDLLMTETSEWLEGREATSAERTAVAGPGAGPGGSR